MVRVRIFFENDSDIKFFVILKHVSANKNPYCKCIKITSKTALYEARPEMLASVVLYQAGDVSFLKKKSVIDPDSTFNIAHEHFQRHSEQQEFKVEGKMPEDFHARLVAAIKKSILLNLNEKNELLEAISEPPILG